MSRVSADLDEDVSTSLQLDRSTVKAMSAMGWRDVCWGGDDPHLELAQVLPAPADQEQPR